MPDSVRVRLTIPTFVDNPNAMVGRMQEIVVRPLWPGSSAHTHTVDLWVSDIDDEAVDGPLAIGVAHFALGALESAVPGDAFHLVGAHVHEVFAATGTIVAFLEGRPPSTTAGSRTETSDAMVTFRRNADTPTYPKVPEGSGALVSLESMNSHVRGELTLEANRFHRGRMWFRLRLPPGALEGSHAGDQFEILDCPAAPWLIGADGRIEMILENKGP